MEKEHGLKDFYSCSLASFWLREKCVNFESEKSDGVGTVKLLVQGSPLSEPSWPPQGLLGKWATASMDKIIFSHIVHRERSLLQCCFSSSSSSYLFNRN